MRFQLALHLLLETSSPSVVLMASLKSAAGRRPVVRLDVLALDHSADRGDVHVDDFGNILVDHRPEPLAGVEEVALSVDDGLMTFIIVSRR